MCAIIRFFKHYTSLILFKQLFRSLVLSPMLPCSCQENEEGLGKARESQPEPLSLSLADASFRQCFVHLGKSVYWTVGL